ncbi:MAG: hypothetical protein DMG68_14680 [Acidobacteria bacterium]|nr:MAG: hypothetical protein DMG68_14680 [Acidobacteriota bacterium]
MSFLRFLMLLSLIVWLGGITFLSFVVAPTAFSGILPSRHLAGTVVGTSLTKLHWMGLVSGVVFLASSMVYSRMTTGSAHPFALRHILLCLMLLLTIVSQFGITPRMTALRTSVGQIDSVPETDPARVQFNALHAWSERLEVIVFFLAIIVVYLTARQFA